MKASEFMAGFSSVAGESHVYSGNMVSALYDTVEIVRARPDMRELSPDAPRYTSAADRCPIHSQLRPSFRCILRVAHAKDGFMYCQFGPEGCIAGIGTDATGENGFECGKQVVPESNYCAAHYEDVFEDSIPCWHADSDRLNEIPELATIRQMEQR